MEYRCYSRRPGRCLFGPPCAYVVPFGSGLPGEEDLSAANSVPFGAETILLVEDEPAIRRLIGDALERAGYRVVEARHGREALERFDDSIDLLLADMRLPHVSGHELIVRLREQRPTLKVLTISGYPLNAPPDVPFLAKPFPREVLLKAVRDVLDHD